MVHSWFFHQRQNYEKGKQWAKDRGNDPEVELFKDVKVGHDVLSQLAYSSWWAWDVESCTFGHLPERYRKAIPYGTKLFREKEQLPHHFKWQMWPADPDH